MFYNTGIATYIWLLSNKKAAERKGKIQLINAVSFFQKLRKSLGSKRKELGEADIARIVKLYGAFEVGEHSLCHAAQCPARERKSCDESEPHLPSAGLACGCLPARHCGPPAHSYRLGSANSGEPRQLLLRPGLVRLRCHH
jgi:hypothetical protein